MALRLMTRLAQIDLGSLRHRLSGDEATSVIDYTDGSGTVSPGVELET